MLCLLVYVVGVANEVATHIISQSHFTVGPFALNLRTETETETETGNQQKQTQTQEQKTIIQEKKKY